MAFIDYYKILGVDKNIPQKDVKRAYLKRAKQFHPDLHPDDPKAKAKFQALNEAYEVINDPDKRQKYDRYGEHWREASDFAGGGRKEMHNMDIPMVQALRLKVLTFHRAEAFLTFSRISSVERKNSSKTKYRRGKRYCKHRLIHSSSWR